MLPEPKTSRSRPTDPQRRSSPPANAGFVFGSRMVAATASTVILVLAAHGLDEDEFGAVVTTMAAGFLVNSLITFGTDTLVTRAVAGDHLDATALALASLRFQVAASLGMVGVATVAVGLGAPVMVLIEAAGLVPLAVVTVAGSVLRGRQRMGPLLHAALAGSVVALAAAVGGLAWWDTPATVIAARALGALATAAVLARAASGELAGLAQAHAGQTGRLERPTLAKPTPSGTRSASTRSATPAAGPSTTASTTPSGAGRVGWVDLVRRAAPFAAMVVLAAVGAQATVLVVEFGTDEPTGGYGAATRLLEAARMVPAAVVAAYFPAMVAGVHHGGRYRQAVGLLVGFCLAAAAGLALTADHLDRVFFDSQPSGPALIRILALALPLTGARLVLSFEAIANDRERRVLLSAVAATAVTMVGAVLLAGAQGATGVAWSQVAGIAAALVVLVGDRLTPLGDQREKSLT